jgi:hypothetical protein
MRCSEDFGAEGTRALWQAVQSDQRSTRDLKTNLRFGR